jgi:hypothetical protein
MKPFQMPWHEFKKVAEDDKSATLAHPKGHQFKIAKSSLTPKLREQLAAIPMQKMAKGGRVIGYSGEGAEPQDQQVSAQDSGDATQPITPDASQASSSHNTNIYITPGPAQPQAQVQPQTVQAAQPAPAQSTMANPIPSGQQNFLPSVPGDTYGIQSQGATINQAGNLAGKGLAGEAAAQGAIGQANVQSLNQGIQEQANNLDQFLTRTTTVDQQRSQMIADAAAQHITPKDIFTGSTPNQIKTGLGILLGGIAGGGKSNIVMDQIQHSIDRDLDAQKAEASNRTNLISHLNQQYGDQIAAAQMAKVFQMDHVNMMLQQDAAKYAGTVAGAKAQQAQADWAIRLAPEVQKAKLLESSVTGNLPSYNESTGTFGPTAQTGTQSGQPQPAQPLSADQRFKNASMAVRNYAALGFIPGDQVKTVNDELSRVGKVEALREQMQGSFNDLSQRAFAGRGLSPQYRAAAIQPYAGQLAKLAEGRFNMQEAQQQVNALMPNVGKAKATLAESQKGLTNMFDDLGKSSVLNGLGIDIRPKGTAGQMSAPAQAVGMSSPSTQSSGQPQLTPVEQAALKQAQANPNDPRAAQFVQMLKRKYGIQ